MKKKGIVALGGGALCIFALLGFWLIGKPFGSKELEKLRIGVAADPISALIYVAHQQGMFKRHGLDVSLENYQSGAYAANDLMAGKIDVAAASDFVLVLQSFNRPDLRTIGTICASDSIELVARADHGINKPEDLRGKRVGVGEGTNSEFFLTAFLSFCGIHPGEVRMVNLRPLETVTALEEGKIDAGISLFSYFQESKKRLGGKAVSWSAQSGQDFFFLLITTEELIKSRSGVIPGLLKGVLEAEAFLKKHEKEAQDIVARTLGLDHEVVMNAWERTHFHVRLDQILLTLMEDEARWAMRSKLVEGKKIPNYLTFLHLEGLKKIKPEAVSVIH